MLAFSSVFYYTNDMQTRYFTVTGMSCAACSANVEKAVSHLAGVETVQVNLLTNRMTVTYNPDTLNTDTIIQTIEKIGYGAFPLSEENTVRPSVQKTDSEIADTEKKQFIFSLFFLIPLMYVSMGRMLKLPLPPFFAGAENALIFVFTQFLLTLPVLILNRRFFTNGLTSLYHRVPNMNSLIAVGSGAAVIYGVFALYRIGYGLGHGQLDVVQLYMKDLYFESSAMILTLISLGKFLEARAKKKTSEVLQKLIQLRLQTAHVLRNGTEIEIPVENIVIGDAIVIRPGQTLPVDGTIIEGSTSLDESAITGESIPVEKTVGDSVISASHNLSGSFTFRADKVGNDTTLARIIALVEEASSSKAPVAKLADVISGYFVPIVMLISLVAFISWLIAGATFEFALSTAISVLVISCPCALGLATPTAIMAGTGKGAQLGILIRSAEGLELAHRITAVLIDKTGTITEGKPTLQRIEVFSERYTDNDILWVAYSLEHLSEHPLAHAIIRAAEEKKLSPFKVSDFMAIHGKGICGTATVDELNGISLIENVRIGAGNTKLCKELAIPISEAIHTRLAEAAEKGASPLLVIIGDECVGLIAVADPVKEGSIRAIHDFHEMGIHTVMLTGDNQRTAEAIQKIVGIGDVVAELLPQDKKAKVEYYRSKGFSPAFIGDGINDAPALTAADVGIAIGGGTDIAIESADIVLMNNSLETAVTAIQLSKAVMRTIKQNLFWALFYNSLCIPLAAGLFYTVFGLRLNPMFAAAAMSFSSVSVVSNALRLNRFRPKRIAQKAHNMQYCDPVPTGKKYDDAKLENITHKEKTNMKNITLTVEGMSCGHCSARVEKALNAIEGVSAKVDLGAKTASVTYPDSVTIDALKAAVTDAGYSVTASH